uniref:Uncharacterized protein n=2 Tax=Parascaris TaxID=6254 RepID=A0A914RS32_PAREQ
MHLSTEAEYITGTQNLGLMQKIQVTAFADRLHKTVLSQSLQSWERLYNTQVLIGRFLDSNPLLLTTLPLLPVDNWGTIAQLLMCNPNATSTTSTTTTSTTAIPTTMTSTTTNTTTTIPTTTTSTTTTPTTTIPTTMTSTTTTSTTTTTTTTIPTTTAPTTTTPTTANSSSVSTSTQPTTSTVTTRPANCSTASTVLSLSNNNQSVIVLALHDCSNTSTQLGMMEKISLKNLANRIHNTVLMNQYYDDARKLELVKLLLTGFMKNSPERMTYLPQISLDTWGTVGELMNCQ